MVNRVPAATVIFLAIAWLLAVAWFVSSPDFEPALTSLALLASISTLYLDLWVRDKRRRAEILKGVVHECYENLNVFKDARFHPDWGKDKGGGLTIYPRMHHSIVDAAVASGLFYGPRDERLVVLLHKWRSQADEFNRRLDVTELRTFVNPTPEEVKNFRRSLTGGSFIQIVRGTLGDLAECLVDNYSGETDIDRETILFGDEAPPPHNKPLNQTDSLTS